jgi:hypothetical protein
VLIRSSTTPISGVVDSKSDVCHVKANALLFAFKSELSTTHVVLIVVDPAAPVSETVFVLSMPLTSPFLGALVIWACPSASATDPPPLLTAKKPPLVPPGAVPKIPFSKESDNMTSPSPGSAQPSKTANKNNRFMGWRLLFHNRGCQALQKIQPLLTALWSQQKDNYFSVPAIYLPQFGKLFMLLSLLSVEILQDIVGFLFHAVFADDAFAVPTVLDVGKDAARRAEVV